MTSKPVFITLDGIDGVGKSTQIQRLVAHWSAGGRDVLTVRDPGSTEIGTRLRSILLDSKITLHRRTEAMLFMASRCEMIETVIRPALSAGKSVISDRFLLANVVYQSVGGQVDPQTLWQIGRLANGGLQPDLTLLLDMPAEASMKRLSRVADRMEARGIEYLETVRQAFLDELPNSSAAHAVIDADQPVDQVTQQIFEAVQKYGF